MALVGASLTSQVIKVTPILPEILTSCPYNCWPLLLRMSVGHITIVCLDYDKKIQKKIISILFRPYQKRPQEA